MKNLVCNLYRIIYRLQTKHSYEGIIYANLVSSNSAGVEDDSTSNL